jgi:hypothetical protein
MRLRQALLGCPTGLLRKIAVKWGLPVEAATLRSELVERLSSELEQRARSKELVRGLDERELLAVRLVGSSGRARRRRAGVGGSGRARGAVPRL